MWTIFKVFVEFITVLLLFHILVFWPGGMWDLSSQAREPAPSALEGEVLTTGLPGSPSAIIFKLRTLT